SVPFVLHASFYLSLTSSRVYLFLFFLLRCPPSPRSSLFPYTTLFRSLRVRGCGGRTWVRTFLDVEFFEVSPALNAADTSKNSTSDRKSTRLNSSHEWISYAVFCLKKKKR